MDIVNGIKNFFGGTASAEHIIKTATDGVYNGLDKAFYTDEEKSEDASKREDRFLTFVERTYDENSIRNVTRRWMAWGIVSWILANAQVAIIFAILNKMDVVKRIIDVATAFSLGAAFLTVLGTYFGVQFFRGKK